MRKLLVLIALALGASMILPSCEDHKQYYVANISSKVPTLRTYDVNTMISDSGYTKYVIRTPLWDMYEDLDTPYWYFPSGVELEQYDTLLRISSTFRCDSAKYFSHLRCWRLDGRVVIVNSQHDSILTNQLFWDQNQRKIYSDSFIHIVKEDRIIEGYGFESNEQISQYNVMNPTGIFPVPEKGSDGGSSQPSPDQLNENDEIRRPYAPQRASEREREDGIYTPNGYRPINTIKLSPNSQSR